MTETDKNCYNCKNCEGYDEGEGYGNDDRDETNSILNGEKVCELLNKLTNENQDLKKANEILMALCEANNIL